MEEGLELAKYLPESYKSIPDTEYMQFLWEAYQTNYEAGKYQFAYLSLHMLFMSFVYFNVWQIKEALEDDFRKALTFKDRIEDGFIAAESPFGFWKENERTIIGFFRLIGCPKVKVSEFRKLVDVRNKLAHTSGNIYFANESSFLDKVHQLVSCTQEMQDYSRGIIQDIYKDFISDSWDEEEREYIDLNDQFREGLIHKYFLSEADIKFCLEFDIKSLSKEEHYDEISSLHSFFCSVYSEDYDEEYCEVCSDVHERLSIIDFYPGGNLIDERGQKNTGAEIEIAECGYCSTTHIKCIECGTSNAVWDYDVGEEKECEGGCGLTYLVSESFDSDAISEGYTFRVMQESI
ncbi:MAG: hypothetical protein ABJH08_10715 [Balneola sp.]